MVWSLTRPSLPYIKFKVIILEFAYKSGRRFEENIRHSTVIALPPPDPLTRGSAPGPHWGLCLDLRYRLALHALAMRVLL